MTSHVERDEQRCAPRVGALRLLPFAECGVPLGAWPEEVARPQRNPGRDGPGRPGQERTGSGGRPMTGARPRTGVIAPHQPGHAVRLTRARPPTAEAHTFTISLGEPLVDGGAP